LPLEKSVGKFQVPEQRWLFIAFLPVCLPARVGTFVDFLGAAGLKLLQIDCTKTFGLKPVQHLE
jgi:hypothetical protein